MAAGRMLAFAHNLGGAVVRPLSTRDGLKIGMGGGGAASGILFSAGEKHAAAWPRRSCQ